MRRVLFAVAILAYSPVARAGGFETPDNGAEALGRGGAFTAKASDATALEYNVAGFARQRGTRVLFDGKLTLNQYSFARDGAYPDAPNDTATPWGNTGSGRPYFFPQVSNQGAPFFAPFVGVSTDFGYFDKLTVAVGAFGPSGVGNPLYPLGVYAPGPPGSPPIAAPSPSRYDVVQSSSLIVLPTVAAAYQLADWIDLGAAFHFVHASFDLVNTAFVDLNPLSTPGSTISPAPCTHAEYQPCDAINHLVMAGNAFTGSGGVMLHPDSWLDVGVNVRGPVTINATGSVTSTPPAVAPAEGTNTAPGTLTTSLPWNVRAGGRVKFMDGAFEEGDVELDGVYEPWGTTANGGNVYITVPQIGPFSNVSTLVRNNFKDVFSVRLGGAYNVRLQMEAVLSLRAGAYYESSATQAVDTRLDFNTLEKYAGTLGAGITWRGVGVNVAYAAIVSPERVVTGGDVYPINPAAHGAPTDPNGSLFPAVNNGRYDGFIQMFSAGVRVELETVFGTARSKRWSGAASSAPATEPAPPEEAREPEQEAKRPLKRPDVSRAPTPAPPRAAPKKQTAARPSKQESDDAKTRRLEDPFAN